MKKNVIHLFGLMAMVFVFDTSISLAQSLERQAISSSGSYSFIDGTLIRQTIGQSYDTKTSYSNQISYRSGFQQPVIRVEPIKSELIIEIFPNPAANFINIESAVVIENANVSLIDNLGRILVNENVKQLKNYKIYCGDFAHGTYVVNITTPERKSFSAKLIINL